METTCFPLDSLNAQGYSSSNVKRVRISICSPAAIFISTVSEMLLLYFPRSIFPKELVLRLTRCASSSCVKFRKRR